MTELLNDQAVAERVLQHIKNKTTDRGDRVWREPVENYISQQRFDAEIEQVLRRYPIPFCPSAALPKAGSYIARDALGIPIIAVRGADSQVRAFRNACRHRGAKVAEEGSGCAKALRCTYHGWTYKLDGSLQHIPHEHGFPGLDKQAHHLMPVHTEEDSGLVFITQEDASENIKQNNLPALLLPEQQLFATREYELSVNWKIFLESFLEGYHIKPAHKDTFFPFGFDNLTLAEYFGDNSRITFPFQRITNLKDVPADKRTVNGLVTYVYHLFPNALMVILSHHSSLVVLEPIAVDKTRVHNYSLTLPGPQNEAKLAQARNDAEFVTNTGQAEDIALAKSIQSSLHSGANDVFTFGHFEPLIVHFHQVLAAKLDGERTNL